MFDWKSRIKQTPRTLNIIGYVLLYLPLSIQIVMILTRKEDFWRAVPVYGEFSLQQQITSFAFCGIAVLIMGTWILINNLRWLYLAMGVVAVIGYNTILETRITYANVPDVRDLVAGVIGGAVHLGLVAAMARFGIVPNLQKSPILKEEFPSNNAGLR